MPEQSRRILWLIVLMVVIGAGALALVVARTEGKANRAATTGAHSPSSSGAMVQGPESRQSNSPRNLSLQPEAFNMGRRLGQRFAPGKRERSIFVGTLTIGSERRDVQTTRTQTDDGELVEISLAGSPGPLTWAAGQGALSAAGRATGGDRDLVERLVLDSPDQFVLAQLRGASYYTVARNVRPAGADDNYAGPLWNIVRVDDPQRDEEKKPESAWRLYYINTRTGLIDRVVSQLRGETIEAEISGWTLLYGENVPSQITWNNQGQRIMQYRLTSFSHGQK